MGLAEYEQLNLPLYNEWALSRKLAFVNSISPQTILYSLLFHKATLIYIKLHNNFTLSREGQKTTVSKEK